MITDREWEQIRMGIQAMHTIKTTTEFELISKESVLQFLITFTEPYFRKRED